MPEAFSPQNSPYVNEVDPGKYAWCACGLSENQPYCDGSHRGSDFSPKIVEVTEKKSIAWCGCKKTKDAPYCDGSHNKVSE
jgi:CDGSH-type Zn-finger protein